MLPRGLLKEYSQILAFVLRFLDAMAIIFAGLLAYYWRFENFTLTFEYKTALLTAAVLTVVVFEFFHIYDSIRAKTVWQHIQSLIQAILVVLLSLAGLMFLTKTGEVFSRTWFMAWTVSSLSLLILFRCSLLLLLRIMRAHGMNERRVIIVGAGELGQKLSASVQQKLWTGFRIIAMLDDHATVGNYIKQNRQIIDEVWITLPLNEEQRIKEILHELRHHTIAVRYALNIFGLDLLKHTITEVYGCPMINLNSSPMIGINRLAKSIEDRMIAAIILLFISPLLLIIAIAIKLTSKGPVLFKQHRHGWGGEIIKIYKFRTMVQHEEDKNKVTQATVSDQRVTRLGRFLRKTSLDELPQFINVLQGRMSIVGPRPHAVVHNEFYKDSIDEYMQRHKVKPGITGWAQVNGWRGETDTLDKMQKRVEYDLFYIENWSLSFDLKIIFLTIFKGFVNKNAY